MSDLRRPIGGSRFLYEPFDYGPAKVQEANEKVVNLKFDAMEARLCRLEQMLERLDRRLWLAVYGVAGTIMAQAAKTLLQITPNGGP